MEVINIDTCIEFEMPTNEYEIWQTTLIAFVWIALETIGNGLLLALIHFYKYGGDPLKWRVVDHVSFEIILCNNSPVVKKYCFCSYFWDVFTCSF